MQAIPVRLSQVIRSTFQASRPVSQPFRLLNASRQVLQRPCLPTRIAKPLTLRFYSDSNKDLDDKVKDAKRRIDASLEAKLDHLATDEPQAGSKAKEHHVGETIIHTHPEASSIVHKRSTSGASSHVPPSAEESESSTLPQPPKPSSFSARFSHLMDNLQANVFVASNRLNDLTGYSAIQRLKDDISAQEDTVLNARSTVKNARTAYAAAVATRSTTQREVNDLLHRKHTWAPGDLERFTNLYRSDHANERAEEQAQQELSRAESAYEESSTRLARTILARYHEEQIWSDKIRQMSTWGTWGLMGLNVLLFVLFQIAIEPWRRRRLVNGFEEKVQEALREVSEKAAAGAQGAGHVQIVVPEREAQGVADSLAGAIVDAISGAEQSAGGTVGTQPDVETVIERVIDTDAAEDLSFPTPVIGAESSGFATTAASGYAYYQETFAELFSERQVLVTQKELTTVAMEGAVGGAALMGLLLVLLRPR